MKQTISIIIVTYNRPKDLARCLGCVAEQSIKPLGVIVVDNSDSFNSEQNKLVCEQFSKMLALKVVKNQTNSLTIGRNLGVTHSRSDVILFLDDDVLIGRDYLKNALEILDKNEAIVGLQGYLKPEIISKTREMVHRFFFWYHHRKNQSLVLPSISAVYPSEISGDIRCEWVSGTNQVYRKFVVDKIKWDENLYKYCDGEDLDHSYRVFLQYPNGIIMTDALILEHKEVANGRPAPKELILMREIYGWYLHKKLFGYGFSNFFKFFWSCFGRLLITLAHLMKSPNRSKINEFCFLVYAYFFVFKNRYDISQGNLKKINETFFGA